MKRFKLAVTVLILSFVITACSEHTIDPGLSPISSNYLPENIKTTDSSMSNTPPSMSVNSTSNSNSSITVGSTQYDIPPTTGSEISVSSPITSPEITVPAVTPPVVTYPETAFLFYNMTDNTLFANENANAYVAPASLLKLLTASVALSYVSPDKVITVGTELALVPLYSSLCLISEGHRLTLYDLLTGMLLASGNDTAYTVAVSTAREVSGKALSDTEAVEYFADLMNAFARDLGMNNSYFVNPDGFDDDRQYTTANDLLLLARYALTVPEIAEITSTHQKYVVFESGHNITWTNSNKLLDPESEYYCPGAIGMKTGTTKSAGCNLIAAFRKDGKFYIAVAVGCKNDAARYKLVTDYYSRI